MQSEEQTIEQAGVPAACPDPCGHCGAHRYSVCRVLPDAELSRLATVAAVRRLAPADALVRQGDPATHVFNVTDGCIMLSTLLADGRRQVLGFLTLGDFIGLRTDLTYSFTAEAVGSATVCRLPRQPFLDVLLQTPALEWELLDRASDDLACAEQHMILLGRKTAEERVASFLIDMANKQARNGGEPNLLILRMTRTDIADYLGLTTETVSRVISAWNRRSIIQLAGHRTVRLLNRAWLDRTAKASE